MAGAKQLILDLLARDKTGPASRSAAKNMDVIGDSAEDAAKSTEKLGDASDHADDQVERLGKSSRTAAQHVDHLDREIELCERELRQLAVAFAEAGTAAERADLSKGIRATTRELKQLEKNKGILSKVIPDKVSPAVGQKIGRSLVKDIGDGLSSAKGPLTAALGASLAPTAAAVIAGAVVGAAGLGGIIGGVALAAKDPAIADRAEAVGKAWVAGVDKQAKHAFLAPTKNALGQVEKFAGASVGKIGKIFDSTAPSLEGFTADVLHAGDAILDSLVVSAGKSGPVLEALGDIVAHTGDSVGDLIGTIADHSDEAASGLRDLDEALQDTLTTVGVVVDGLLTLKGAIDAVDETVHKSELGGAVFDAFKTALEGPIGMVARLKGAYDEWRGSSDEAKVSTDDLADSTLVLGDNFSNAEKAARGETDALVALSAELKAQTDPVFKLLNAKSKLASAQTAVNDAEKEHGKTSEEYRSALRKAALAALELESAAGAVASTSSGKLTPELKATLRAAGFTEAEIKDLAGQFRSAKKDGDAFAKTYAAKVSVSGTEAASARVQHVRDLLAQVRSKKISVSVLVNDARLNAVEDRLSRYEHRAGGGSVAAGKAYIVGEKRPEVFVPNQDGTIIPSVSQFGSAAAGVGAGAGSAASGGGWVVIRGDAFIDDLTRAIAKRVDDRGGRAAQLGIRIR